MSAASGGGLAYEKIKNGGLVCLALDWCGDWLDCLYRLYGYKMDKLITALHMNIPAAGRRRRA